jgi:hypothetical protein
MNNLPNTIFKHWLHSYEDQSESGIEVYRPKNYPFPLSRGRKGFEIKPDGGFISYDIAATDGYDVNIGKWDFKEPNELIITFKDLNKVPYRFLIIHSDEHLLKIKKISQG